jgi:ribosome-binding factor A
MTSFRIKQVNKVILEVMNKIFQDECQFPDEALVTILGVETSPDLLYSKIAVSVFPSEKSREVLEYLNKRVYQLQHFLNKKLDMRPVPKIKFILDATEEGAERVEELLEKIKKEE